MKNFWNEIKKPILCLAPMADVTDVAFRYIIAKVSAEKVSLPAGFADFSSKNTASLETFSAYPYVTYTEFVSADGLVKAPEIGRQKLLKDLEYSEIERPIVAQFFTSKPEMIEKAAELAVELGFDGVDINMGCPDKSIEKQGAGASLMKNPKLAREIIAAAKIGTKNKIPVSVKTRIGYHRDELETWLPEILAENPTVVVLHARTRKEMSKVPARWEHVKRAVEIRDQLKSQTLIIGNGDVLDINDAYKKCAETGADGAMLGRAVFGNPWLFANLASVQQSCQIEHPEQSEGYITPKERLRVLAEHITLFDEKLGGFKSFAVMKKHFKEYLKDLSLRDFRYKLMRTENAKEAVQLVKDFLILYN
ncbi:MAG: tRNA-dihydrouridine synthase [Candidatus Paceibacterota bacterium]|jgi:nifR3 family TIM-barrel protein